MGNMVERTYTNFMYPDISPEPYGPVTFDPHYGFKEKREERVMIASEAELRALKIPKDKWDYCAHTLIEVERCRMDNFPLVYRCKPEVHAASMCQYEDYKMRRKEFERERRLLCRKKRIEERKRKEEEGTAAGA